MFTAAELFAHMQKYTREVFAARLREEGFSSYKGQDIHWYRLVNNEVVQSVHFVPFHAAPCTFAEIKYGCHPLFIPPVFQKSPLMNGLPDYVQISDLIPETVPGSTAEGVERLLLYSLYNNRPYREPDALIMCSPDQNDGLDVLEKLLSILNRTTTAPACYELHKELSRRYFKSEESIRSTYLVDEALYWKDEERYPYCSEFVEGEARCLEHTIKNGSPIPKVYRQSWEQSVVLKRVFEEGSFEEYLSTLQNRAEQTLRLLERHAGIQRNL